MSVGELVLLSRALKKLIEKVKAKESEVVYFFSMYANADRVLPPSVVLRAFCFCLRQERVILCMQYLIGQFRLETVLQA